jgi:D-glycero-beta-D-manno-heptose 1-phosphate adenylyltransferase
VGDSSPERPGADDTSERADRGTAPSPGRSDSGVRGRAAADPAASAFRRKLLSRDELVATVAAERRAGRTIALANGCFDLLHVGHVRYLQGAAAEADVLVVAINDDDMAARKGPGRPLLTALDRAEMVAAFRGVDYVTIFPEPTVDALLALVKPDVHCKGTDYTADSVPERATVLAYGGRIAIVGDAKDHSTRDLLARVRERSAAAGAASEERGDPGAGRRNAPSNR